MAATAAKSAPLAPRPPLNRTVRMLAMVSLLTDVSSDMIYPLLPAFLTATLGVSTAFVGAIEGMAESTAALLKLASGWWSDRMARRKPLVVAGYTLAALTRPLMALAGSGAQVLAIRLMDRVGKGIRTAPRDALLTDATPPEERGHAFGFYRAADNFGAVLGPLIAFALMRGAGVPLRSVFWLAAIPGALAVVLLVVAVPDSARVRARVPAAVPGEAIGATTPLGGRFWGVLAAVLLFSLGNSTDAFLLLRATELGVPLAVVPLLWAAHNLVKSLSGTPSGSWSDRIGRRPVLLVGWGIFALVYAGFAMATATWHAWALFVVYGAVFGLAEGTERALIADLAPSGRRGAAFGWFNAAVGLGALPASLLFGFLWSRYGSATAFLTGAALATAAAVVLSVVPLRARGMPSTT